MRAVLYISIFALLSLMITAFQQKSSKSQRELMEEYINEKIEQVKAKEWAKCYKNTAADAEQYVDSIIYRQVNFNIGDTLKAPGKPQKPKVPFDTLKLDTTPIVPILKDTSSQ